MSHPLDEVKDTPWGKQVTQDILNLNIKVDRWGNRMTGLETILNANTATTNLIKVDTQWLRDFVNGSKAVVSFMVPLVLIIGGIVAILAAISGWLHGKG